VQHDVRGPLIAQKDVRRGYFDLQTHRVHQSVLIWRFFFQSSKKLVFFGLFRGQIPKKIQFFKKIARFYPYLQQVASKHRRLLEILTFHNFLLPNLAKWMITTSATSQNRK